MFEPGTLVNWKDTRWRILAYSSSRVVLEGVDTDDIARLPEALFIEKWGKQEIVFDGDRNVSRQCKITDADLQRILFRKPYAEAFNQRCITREDFPRVIQEIKKEQKHDLNSAYPSRATVYRWAANLARTQDPLALRFG